MWTLLFDIDGTLLRTRGAGLHSMAKTMRDMFGVSEIPKVSVHGRTDVGIITDIFEPFGISAETHKEEFFEQYSTYLQQSIGDFEGAVLPGVSPLLTRLSKRDDVQLGLLTGNCRAAAAIKIEYFGLASFFSPLKGGFGDHHADRSRVAEAAVASFQPDLDIQKTWVIGDTPNDISCARAVGAKVLAVKTGGNGAVGLEKSGPDLLLDDLSETEKVIGLML